MTAIVFSGLLLAACSSQGSREVDASAQQATDTLAQQEAARAAAERARQQQAQQRQQAAEEAELARLAAEDQQRMEQERAEREARAQEIRARDEQEQRRLAEFNREREEKMARIGALEQQIARLQSDIAANDEARALYEEAIAVAEETLMLLAAEQDKYADSNIDASGQPRVPLAKDQIADLEQQQADLTQRANERIR